MLKLNLKPIAFTATDYALVVWSEINVTMLKNYLKIEIFSGI